MAAAHKHWRHRTYRYCDCPQNQATPVDPERIYRLHHRKENFLEQVLGEGDHFGAFRHSALHIQPEGEVTILLQGVC
jgi:hypothetical protein